MHELAVGFFDKTCEKKNFSVVSRIFIVGKCSKTNPSVSSADSSLYTREPLNVLRMSEKNRFIRNFF